MSEPDTQHAAGPITPQTPVVSNYGLVLTVYILYLVGFLKVIGMDWDRLIPGHPGPDGRQIGTKDDARDALAYLQDLSAAVKQAADDHKCLDQAMREVKLPKYEKWANYEQYLPMNIERFCDLYSLGI